MFKILHQPSLAAHLIRGEHYLNYEIDYLTIEALDHSVYYAATASLTEEQCTSLFGARKSAIVAKYRLASEVALAHADPAATDDLTVLQAFVLYLVSADFIRSSLPFYADALPSYADCYSFTGS